MQITWRNAPSRNRLTCCTCGYLPEPGAAVVIVRPGPGAIRKLYHATRQEGWSSSCWENTSRQSDGISPRAFWEERLQAHVRQQWAGR